MGIYYSSVGTRLNNYLRHEGLTVEDFAVISPELVMRIHNLGRKAKEAVIERLEEMNMKPGKWMGTPDLGWYNVLTYYKENKEEIRKENPIVYIEKPETFDWSAFRREAARDFLRDMIVITDGLYPDPQEVAGMAVLYADELIKQLKEGQE